MDTSLYESPFGILVLVVLLIFTIAAGGDYGTHEDTGYKVKSLNTSDGKRLRQRRGYYKKKALEFKDIDEDKYLYYTNKYNDTWE